MGYKIVDVEGIGAATAEKLAKAGVTRTNHLLEKGATPEGRKTIAQASGLAEKDILKFANLADLMRVKGVAEEYSELLEAAGVDTVKELKTRVAANLHAKLTETNTAKKMVRRAPTLKEVEKWVAFAKTLDSVLKY